MSKSFIIDLGLKDEKFIIDLNKLIYIEEGQYSKGVRFECRGMYADDIPNVMYFRNISFDDATERILRMWGNSFLYVKTCDRSDGKFNRRIIINKDYIAAVHVYGQDRSLSNIVLDRGQILVNIDVPTIEKLITGDLKYKDVYK